MYKNVVKEDGKYFYYAHGPLARTEIGNLTLQGVSGSDPVQGMDYAYTLQGWIKGVNSNNLNANNDIGQDGLSTSINKNFAHDAFGYSLNYFNGDYDAIDPARWSVITNRFEADKTGSDLIAARHVHISFSLPFAIYFLSFRKGSLRFYNLGCSKC